MAEIGSRWDGLNKSLLCRIYPVKRKREGDKLTYLPAGDIVVVGPISEATIEQTQNWTSPFEAQAADAKFGTLSAMLQSGSADSILNAIAKYVSKDGAAGGAISGADSALATLNGASGTTKLNSTQIFSGSPPLKISLSMHFRAYFDAKKEVEDPVDQLMQWMLPEFLAPDGFITNAINQEGIVKSVYPSMAPSIVAMEYAGKLFSPMVIENVSIPLTTPRTAGGAAIYSTVQMTIASLTALDRQDWAGTSMR